MDEVREVLTELMVIICELCDLQQSYERLQDALSSFIDLSLERGSKDNMSVLVILLNQTPL